MPKPTTPLTSPSSDDPIDRAIQLAKLGGARRDAQEDTCGPFAAALYDALQARGIPCSLWAVCKHDWAGRPEWYHALVEVGGRYYDSRGLFTEEILRKRLKLHPSVALHVSYKPDSYSTCYDEELADMHAFCLKMLSKSFQAEGLTAEHLVADQGDDMEIQMAICP